MRFYHIADVHLGAVPDGCAPWSKTRGEEIYDSFVRLIDQAKLDKIELLLIAGDLFHHQPLHGELAAVNELFASMEHTQVVLIPGKKDGLCPENGYRTFPFAENVHFLDGEKQTCVRFPEWDTVVYGVTMPSGEVFASEKAGCSIFMQHREDQVPESFWHSGFSYIALGGDHRPKIWQENRILNAGALEPVKKTDLGVHGFVEGAYQEGRLAASFVPFALRSYQKLFFYSDRNTTEEELVCQLREEIEEKGVRDLYCVEIRGIRTPGTEFQPEHFTEIGNIAEFVDHSEPEFDLEKLKQEHGKDLIGRYIAYFERADQDEISRKALYRGLLALTGAEEYQE